jgi:hypothetical protein
MVTVNRSQTTRPHGVIYQKVVLFIVTGVRTSNPNYGLVILRINKKSLLLQIFIVLSHVSFIFFYQFPCLKQVTQIHIVILKFKRISVAIVVA